MRFFLFLILLVWVPEALAQQAPERLTDLAEMTLDELMQIEVTSVSRREESLFEAAAAVYVLTQEDLRRSGATTVPEALRLVPGLQVARTNAYQWAISARGFNNQFANKLLVLVDGRSVYTPLFAGVYWDVQDLMLKDVERIEVIRGPGATLWGANAVNGVINIITKSSHQVPGWLIAIGGGTEEQASANLRYGGHWNDALHYKAYATYQNRDNLALSNGLDGTDGWDLGRGGFRVEWDPRDTDVITLQGDVYSGNLGEGTTGGSVSTEMVLSRPLAEVSGGNLLGHWIHAFSPRVRTVSQLYVDRTERRDPFLGEERNTLDLDVHSQLTLGDAHQMVWGLGYRMTQDQVEGTSVVSLDPTGRTDHLFNVFVQDEVRLVPKRLRLTLGAKVEHNSYTGVEIQPSARLLWTPHDEHTAWGSLSRAVRTPSRVESDIRLVLGSFTASDTLNTIVLVGNPDLHSDELLAWELGYRTRPMSSVFLDVATFYNVYSRLVTVEPGDPIHDPTPPPPRVFWPVRFENLGSGRTWGVELAATWAARSWLRLGGSYTWLEMDLERDASSRDNSTAVVEGNDPEQQFRLQAQFHLPKRVDLDFLTFYVDRLAGQGIPAYVRMDVRLEWRPVPSTSLVLAGQNLLDKQHPEFGSTITSAHSTEAQRGVYAEVVWRY